MDNAQAIRQDITMIISRNLGGDVGKFFLTAYEEDTVPILLHHSFVILKELLGENKAREQLDLILKKYTLSIKYD